MGYPIKTSNDQWLAKTRELYYQRVNINIIDDTSFFTEDNLNVLDQFRGLTLPNRTLQLTSMFYALALLCVVLGYLSLSLVYSSILGLVFSFIGTVVCLFIPTRTLLKNKSPNISITDSGFEIIFNRKE